MGTTLHVSVSAESDCTIEYRFARSAPGSANEVVQDWSTDKTFTYTVTDADQGEYFRIIPAVRDSDPRSRFGDEDDYTYLSYVVEADP